MRYLNDFDYENNSCEHGRVSNQIFLFSQQPPQTVIND
jgi:hypothetical protein